MNMINRSLVVMALVARGDFEQASTDLYGMIIDSNYDDNLIRALSLLADRQFNKERDEYNNSFSYYMNSFIYECRKKQRETK